MGCFIYKIGLNIHEDPKIRSENLTPLRNGMVFSVEPGIYIPRCGVVRIEDVGYLKNGKAGNLTRTSKVLRVLREIKLVKK